MIQQRTKRLAPVFSLLLASVGAASSFLSAGCGSDFDPGSRVLDVRILAVRADQPMAPPGATVNLDALVVDPLERPISIGWATCINPNSTIVNACLGKIAQDAASSGKIPSFSVGVGKSSWSVVVPDDALSSLPEEARSNAYVGVVTVACPGTIRVADPSSWTEESNPIACLDASGVALPAERYVVSVKRIWVRDKDRNKNPTISSVTLEGVPWPEGETKELIACSNTRNLLDDCNDGQQVKVSLGLDASTFESGTDESGTPYEEQLITQFYGEDSAFQFDVRLGADATTKFALRRAPSGATRTLWFVARDDRGGVSWVTRKARVR